MTRVFVPRGHPVVRDWSQILEESIGPQGGVLVVAGQDVRVHLQRDADVGVADALARGRAGPGPLSSSVCTAVPGPDPTEEGDRMALTERQAASRPNCTRGAFGGRRGSVAPAGHESQGGSSLASCDVADQQPNPQVRFDLRIAEALEGGVYANMVAVGHTPHEFTLDFSTMEPAQAKTDDAGVVAVPCRVTSRVRLPVSLIFDLLQAINTNLGIYESRFGPIRRPGDAEPLYPPDDLSEGGPDA